MISNPFTTTKPEKTMLGMRKFTVLYKGEEFATIQGARPREAKQIKMLMNAAYKQGTMAMKESMK